MGACAREDVTAQRISGQHDVAKQWSPCCVLTQLVNKNAEVRVNEARSIFHRAIRLMVMCDTKDVSDAGGVAKFAKST